MQINREVGRAKDLSAPRYVYHLPNYGALRRTEYSLLVCVLPDGVQSCTGASSTQYCCSPESTGKEKCRYVEIIYESPPVVPSQAGYILLKMVRGRLWIWNSTPYACCAAFFPSHSL